METRAAKKQQELEEQLASLIGLVRQQQVRQEELAQHQEQQVERLVKEQQQWAQHHGDQVKNLMKDQQQQWEQVALQQRATDERTNSIHADLQTTKETVGARLHAVEEECSALQEAQRVLAEELRGEQEAFQEDIRRKVDTWTTGAGAPNLGGAAGTQPLRATATEFIPSRVGASDGTPEGLEPGAGDGPASTSGRISRPPPYDGRSAWDAYRTQFEMLAEMNRWSNKEKATYLAVSLRGSALTVLSNLPIDSRCDYEALATALESRFGFTHQAELNRMKLRSRTRRREETLPELAEDIERLVRLAYPDAAPLMLEVLAKDQFVDALADEDMRLRVRQSRPATLRKAVEAALELESYQLASRQRSNKTVRARGTVGQA